MKIAIVGSRNYSKLQRVSQLVRRLDSFFEDIVIVSGGARGVDLAAANAAKLQKLNLIEFFADWETYGKSAGYRRNKQIVDFTDVVVAFWDETSKGTQHSINLAKEQNKPTFLVLQEAEFSPTELCKRIQSVYKIQPV